MENAVLLYTTWPSVVEAEDAGRDIVRRRLAACVNILPGMQAHYWWKGAIERAEEAVRIIKTRASMAEAASAAIKQLHSYETPAIIVLRSRASIRITTSGLWRRRPQAIIARLDRAMIQRLLRKAGCLAFAGHDSAAV